jgi:hypothetical protein
MKSPDSLSTQLDSRNMRLLTSRIGAVILVTLVSGCATKEPESTIQEPSVASSTYIDIPSYQTEGAVPSISPDTITAKIDKNITASIIRKVDLFDTGMLPVAKHYVYRENNFIDLVPPVQDGVFSIILPNKNDNPAGYSFNGTLATDEKGAVTGDLLIGGHTNSGDEWIMNNIGGIQVGDTHDIETADAVYIFEVTKITHIKKTGNTHAWPGFDKALGEDGAIFGCRLTTDENGNTIQSGDVTIVGIKIISAKTIK